MNKVLIKTLHEAYATEDVDTVTVAELIRILERFDQNAKIMLSYNGGYSYGGLRKELFTEVTYSTYHNTLLKAVSEEHAAVAEKLEAKLEKATFDSKEERWNAARAAVFELSQAMDQKYHADALEDIVWHFGNVLAAAGCGFIEASLNWEEVDENEDTLDYYSVKKWESATQMEITCEGLNWTAPGCTKHETFAAYVVDCILSTIATAHESPVTYVEGNMQYFKCYK